MHTTTISCYIIDDEQAAIDDLKKHIAKIPGLELKGSSTDTKSALIFLKNNEVDCLFLDINMKPITGVELIQMVSNKAIFTTAHEQYVMGALAHPNTIDYLVKPIYFERFLIAVKKIEDLFFANAADGSLNRYAEGVPIKKPHGTEYLPFEKISYIKAAGNYSTVFHEGERSVVPTLLNDLESLLPATTFIRIHRSFIVNKNKLLKTRYEEAELEGDIILPIGRSYRSRLV